MPYIEANARPRLDDLMNPLIDYIMGLPLEQQDAYLDYVVTRMLKSLYAPPFFNFNRAIGVLNSIMLEYYRSEIGKYEEDKVKEHGEVKPRLKARQSGSQP
ncbi:MAG: hypothetical protein HYX94_03930 [Chloroflexi bacterium]|nr:hypothetical protein [Chloroflexota bacterium]